MSEALVPIALAVASLAWALLIIRVFERDELFATGENIMSALTSRLIDDWRKGLKLWSVRLNITGAGFTALLLALPDTLTAAWGSLPADITANVPAGILRVIPLLLFVAATIARFIKQKGTTDA